MNRTVRIAITGVALALVAAVPASAVVNGKIAFDRGRDILVMNPDGSNKTNLTPTTEAFEGQAQFSPDGQSLAYVSTPAGLTTGEADDVWVADADGANPRQVTNLGVQIEGLQWTADGARLLFAAERDANDNNSEIYSINPDGTGLALVTANAAPLDTSNGFFTAGTKVVLASLVSPATDYEIYIVNTDGTGFTRLTTAAGADTHPILSPDATKIAWSSDRDNPPNEFSVATEMYEMNADGSNQRPITTSQRADSPVAFSPDNTLLGFNYNGYASLMAAAGGPPTQIVDSDNFRFFSDWSPDGQRIVTSYIVPLPGEDDPEFILYSTDREGKQEIALTDRSDSAVYQDWQPAATAPTDPPMTLEATPRAEAQKAKKARATIECSNECKLLLKATGTAGRKHFKSKTHARLYGNQPTELHMIKFSVAKQIAGKRGEVNLKIKVIEGVGGAPKTTVSSTLKP